MIKPNETSRNRPRNSRNRGDPHPTRSRKAANRKTHRSGDDRAARLQQASNEQLRSLNEELVSANAELLHTNAELGVANYDILHLLDSLDLSVILLDRNFHVRRFTTAAKRRFSLSAADLGRRFSDIRLPLDAPELDRLLLLALKTGQAQRWEAQARDGRWYSLQIRPCVTAASQTEGAVLILRDIAEDLTRLAHEIHDTLAQNLAGIVIHLEGADQVLAEHPNAARKHVRKALLEARKGMAETRRAIQALHPSASEDLPRAIKRFANEITGGAGIHAKISLQGQPRRLPQATAENLFRIAQEAVRNAVSHGKAGEIRIFLTYAHKNISLTVEDNGRGFSPSRRRLPGHGLVFIKERVQQVAGHLHLRSRRGKGTRLEVRVPVAPVADAGLLVRAQK